MVINFEETMQVVNLLSKNQLIFIVSCFLFSISFAIYVSLTIVKVIERQKYYMAQLMEYVDDVLYSLQRTGMVRFEKYLHDNNIYDARTVMAVQAILHNSLFTRTRERIKLYLYRDGSHSKRGDDLEHYINLIGARLRNKNQSDLELNSRDLISLVRLTNDIRDTESEIISVWGDIVKTAKQLRREEIRDVLKIIFFWRLKND